MNSVIDCAYCGLPVPGARPDTTGQPQYCCYGCSLAVRIAAGDDKSSSPSLTRTRTLLGVAIFLSMNVMVVNWMLYGQEVYGQGTSQPDGYPAHVVSLFRYLSMLFATPVLAILGWPILENGVRALRSGRITTDLLIALGAVAAFLSSYVAVMRESGSTYFDTVCMILVLVTLGKYMEATAKIKTTSAIHDIERLLPDTVTVRRGRDWVEAPLLEVVVGNVVRIKPGSRISADGVVVENESHVDEQLVTGESTPVLKRCGDRVFAGSLNGDGTLSVEVRAIGDGTVLSEMVDLLLAARRSKGRYERLADRLAAVFVPGVLVLSIVAGVLALPDEGFDGAIMRSLAVLLISCPCALGLATPMAVWVALGRSARKGVLFRNVVAMELLAKVRTMCFDKTGTLTTGQAAVTSFDARLAGEADEVLSAAAGLARQATHHLSAGIVRFVGDRGAAPAEIANVQSIAGRGVAGTLASVGSPVSLGSPAFMAEQDLHADETMRGAIDRLEADGKPLACIGWDGAVRGVFSFAEDLRPEAEGVLDWLRNRGLSLRILTGDHHRRGEQMAERLGVEVEAGLLPADKIDRIRALASSRHPVAMVGDGINDAPALAAADVGIAMGCGADVTRESADVTLASNDLSMLPWSISLSARTVRVIKQNLFWAFGYNTVGIALAMTGRLSPIFAAIAMVVSSFLVATNSLRLNHVDLPSTTKPS